MAHVIDGTHCRNAQGQTDVWLTPSMTVEDSGPANHAHRKFTCRCYKTHLNLAYYVCFGGLFLQPSKNVQVRKPSDIGVE